MALRARLIDCMYDELKRMQNSRTSLEIATEIVKFLEATHNVWWPEEGE